jgi:hypothetical protein
MDWDHLPADVIIKFALDMDIREITNLCSVSKRFNKSICDNNDFWVNKLAVDYDMNYLDFNNPRQRSYYSVVDTPKEFYKKIHKIENLDRQRDAYKYTGYNIKLIDYYLNKIGERSSAMIEAGKLSDVRQSIKVINHLHGLGESLDGAMNSAIVTNNQYLMDYIEDVVKGTDKYNDIIIAAAQGAAIIGNVKLLNEILKKGNVPWDGLVYSAAQGDQLDTMESMLTTFLGYNYQKRLLTDHLQTTFINIILGASSNGSYNILESYIGFKNGKYTLFNTMLWTEKPLLIRLSSIMLMGAAMNNDKWLMNKAFENEVSNYMLGAIGAAIGGNKDNIYFFVTKGIRNFPEMYAAALSVGNMKAADYIRELSDEIGEEPIDINNTLIITSILSRNNKPALLRIIKEGFNHWDEAIAMVNEQTNPNQEFLEILMQHKFNTD